MEQKTSCYILLSLIFLANINDSDEAKILAIFPMPAKSHMAVNSALLKELANRGHQVTVYNGLPEEETIPNYKHVQLKEATVKDLLKDYNLFQDKEPNAFDMLNVNPMIMIFTVLFFSNIFCEYTFPQEPIQKLINSNEEFDLLIIDAFFSECLHGFAHKFKTPMVQIVSFGGAEVMHDYVGNPSPYSYIPDPYLGYSDRMNFIERLLNTLSQTIQKLARKLYFAPSQNKIMRKYFDDPNMPSVEELGQKTALLLVNQHFSVSHPRPLMPNAIQIGGIHLKPAKKLPADIQKFMDEAPSGVIYFSMGSNLRSTDMSQQTLDAFIDAFSEMKQKVLWKWENDTLPRQPPNLKVAKWFPQSDILAHPNIRLFITHGGFMSTLETINSGVPVVGIPIYGDQRLNMAQTVAHGYGLKLYYSNISKESILWTVREVLNNPKYKESVQYLSRIFRDQPLKPLDQAIFWTEYVIRHKGAPHMRSAVLDLNWYQYYLLDVIAVLTITVAFILLVTFMVFKTIFRCCKATKEKPVTSLKKKNN